MDVGWFLFLIFILLPAGAFAQKAQVCPIGQYDHSQWTLNWEDQFQTPGRPDHSKWLLYEGPNVWTDEIEYYTTRPENIRVEGGRLILEARKEDYLGHWHYTSGRIHSRHYQTYGRFEVCANIPGGVKGTWSALWMLPRHWKVFGDEGWPDNGEIDFAENVGMLPEQDILSAHTKEHNYRGTGSIGYDLEDPNITNHFHLFALEWYPDHLDYFVDNVKYFTVKKESDDWQSWPFKQDFFLIMNLAIGGDWATEQGLDEDKFPVKMTIDSVRVFNLKNQPAAN